MVAEAGKVLYFGYGANREPRMMAAITGNSDLVGHSAILEGFTLCVQKFDQVPNVVSPTSPAPVSPKQILKDAGWNPDTFESYIIKPDEKGRILGMIWELTSQERELVREWELVDFGWYKDIATSVRTPDGIVQVQTEGLREEQSVDREIDGIRYKSWLQSPEDFERVAEKSRREYFERIALTKEGSLQKEQN